MYYRKLGSTGHLTGEIGFDARSLATVSSDDEAVSLVRHAIGQGAGFIDTAGGDTAGGDTAGNAHGDQVIARALDGRREEALIAARGGMGFRSGAELPDFSPEQVTRSARESLERLRCGYLELFQLDRPTVDVLRDENLWQALGELKSEGIIRHIGVIAPDLAVALAALEDNRVETLQIVFNALDPSLMPVLARARAAGVGIIVRDPLVPDPAGGVPAGAGDGRESEHAGPVEALRQRVSRLLQESGDTAAPTSLGWVLAHEAVSVAIIGAGSVAQFEQILTVSGRRLPSTRQMLAIRHAQLTAAVS